MPSRLIDYIIALNMPCGMMIRLYVLVWINWRSSYSVIARVNALIKSLVRASRMLMAETSDRKVPSLPVLGPVLSRLFKACHVTVPYSALVRQTKDLKAMLQFIRKTWVRLRDRPVADARICLSMTGSGIMNLYTALSSPCLANRVSSYWSCTS